VHGLQTGCPGAAPSSTCLIPLTQTTPNSGSESPPPFAATNMATLLRVDIMDSSVYLRLVLLSSVDYVFRSCGHQSGLAPSTNQDNTDCVTVARYRAGGAVTLSWSKQWLGEGGLCLEKCDDHCGLYSDMCVFMLIRE
jgi:hypothetical protein